jgi:hypothetical protein
MISSASIKLAGPAERLSLVACQGIEFGMVPIRILTVLPVVLFFAALSAMLLRPPDVAFYEVDRIAFAVLLLSVAARTLLSSERLRLQRATWPMMGLTLIAVASVIGEPFDSENWSLLSAKFIVPFALFHVASLVFRNERNLRKFELFALVVLAYLCFTSIAFLVGANSLIFSAFHFGRNSWISRGSSPRPVSSGCGKRRLPEPAGPTGYPCLSSGKNAWSERGDSACVLTHSDSGHDDPRDLVIVCGQRRFLDFSLWSSETSPNLHRCRNDRCLRPADDSGVRR